LNKNGSEPDKNLGIKHLNRNMKDGCLFCNIIEGEIPSHKVYEDENVMAFLDANPVSKGHTLVVPKKHVENIHGSEGMSYMWDAIVNVSNAVKAAFNPGGINIDQNNGAVADQEIFHLHFHVIPRYDGSEIDMDYDKSELEEGEDISSDIASELT
jgi:histidine triad (HIT) family protein